MTILSCLKNCNSLGQKFILRATEGQLSALKLSTSVVRSGGHGPTTFQIRPSQYWWQHYKDDFHFYTMLGLIPGLIVVFITNVFIGPSTISEIPEGYVPKKWEYYRHPITRYIAYLKQSNQQVHERNMWYINEEDQKTRMRLLQWKVERLMKERGDYPYYHGTDSKYAAIGRMEKEELEIRLNQTQGIESRGNEPLYTDWKK